jgi:UDP-N-acetylglucosamine 1-carboxyvinyltransferase
VVLEKLASTGAEVTRYGTEGFRVAAADRPRAVDVVTLPYPGFPTDLLAPAIALGTVAEGASMVTENVFDARFMFVNELARLGADARTDGHHAVVRGKHVLSGAPVRATDIRAGAALVLAGLCADGVTEVADVHHIDRGYPDFVPQLESLGADVRRVTVPDVELPPAL